MWCIYCRSKSAKGMRLANKWARNLKTHSWAYERSLTNITQTKILTHTQKHGWFVCVPQRCKHTTSRTVCFDMIRRMDGYSEALHTSEWYVLECFAFWHKLNVFSAEPVKLTSSWLFGVIKRATSFYFISNTITCPSTIRWIGMKAEFLTVVFTCKSYWFGITTK